jgi:hypothetical protein
LFFDSAIADQTHFDKFFASTAAPGGAEFQAELGDLCDEFIVGHGSPRSERAHDNLLAFGEVYGCRGEQACRGI